ncbi:MAG: ABC transporter ATP-binding protein [Candidatus Lokiarchaeota archaeon]|nr:ABC transporter ATP-binding protein [Candidatus Lokiarchaeota archaeon]
MSSTKEPIIKIQGLTKEYYNRVVVDNINLEILNSCFAFLGPNGAGKTTLMLMLLGLVKPSNGTASIFGNNILNSSGKIRRKIGFLPENVGFYPNLTGRKFLNLITGLRKKGGWKENDIEAYLDWSGIDKRYWDKTIKTYSRGMKQRLGIAQAFAGEPKLVFLDEPLSNIDPLGREEFIQKIRMKREEGITVIISSHIVLEIEQIADYIAFIDNGKIKASDKIYSLAQFYGFDEYEITRIDHNERITLKEVNELLSSEKDIFFDLPKILREKIIFRTNNPEKVDKILLNYKDFNFTPISGTLNELYKKIIQGELYEKRE